MSPTARAMALRVPTRASRLPYSIANRVARDSPDFLDSSLIDTPANLLANLTRRPNKIAGVSSGGAFEQYEHR